MLHPVSTATQPRRGKGEFKVQLLLPEPSYPRGSCDCSPADVPELRAIAEAANSSMKLDVKVLKTSREIWTLRSGS